MKALASDFDGTLYFMGQENPVKPADVEAIAHFQQMGHLFGICSGRSLRGILDFSPELHFDFYILVSGALILDQDFQEIAKYCIDYDLMKQVYDRYEKDLMIVVQANDNVYCLQAKIPMQGEIDSIEELKEADIYGLSFGTKSEEEAGRIAAEVRAAYGDQLEAFANVKNVDIVAKGCSKGNALSIIRNHYGIDQFAGIGDSYNDIPMLENVDYAYTFPYAPEAAQAIACQLVHNVAEAIEDFR